MSRNGGGCLKALAAVLSVALVAVVAVGVALVLRSQDRPSAPVEQELAPKAFADYSWEELSEISSSIASAATDEEGRAVAEGYNVHVGDMRRIKLRDDTVVDVTVVGLRADERSDGSGKAGITLMCSPISTRPMNDSATNEGGWASSGLRSWLAADGLALLPEELSSQIVSVRKSTNNTGVTSDASSVTQTDDALWLFSASEVCGALTWFANEYGDAPNAWTGYVDYTVYDALLSSEGSQYELFSAAGVTGESDPSGVLEQSLRGTGVAWWYRTSYPYSFTGTDASFFYQVMASGFPSSVGDASSVAGVVVGFCL